MEHTSNEFAQKERRGEMDKGAATEENPRVVEGESPPTATDRPTPAQPATPAPAPSGDAK